MLDHVMSRGAAGASLADLLAAVRAQTDELRAMRRAADAQAPAAPEMEIQPIAFGSDTAPYQVGEQLRILSITVWANLQGMYTLQRGADTSIRFLATPNTASSITGGRDQEIVLSRGQTLTIVPAANIAGAVWYVLMFAVAGVNPFRQNA